MWDHYVYILISQSKKDLDVQNELDKISAAENKNIQHRHISLYLEPLREIVLPRNMSNSIGPTVDRSTFTIAGNPLPCCDTICLLQLYESLDSQGVKKGSGDRRKKVSWRLAKTSISSIYL